MEKENFLSEPLANGKVDCQMGPYALLPFRFLVVVSHDSAREVNYLARNLVMPQPDHEDGKSPHLRRASDLSMGSRNPVLMAYIKSVLGLCGTSVHVASCQFQVLSNRNYVCPQCSGTC